MALLGSPETRGIVLFQSKSYSSKINSLVPLSTRSNRQYVLALERTKEGNVERKRGREEEEEEEGDGTKGKKEKNTKKKGWDRRRDCLLLIIIHSPLPPVTHRGKTRNGTSSGARLNHRNLVPFLSPGIHMERERESCGTRAGRI